MKDKRERFLNGTIMKKCVFSGTFDPPTVGHQKIIETCLELFDEVVAVVMVNPDKEPFLTAEERRELLEKLFADDKRVKVITFRGAAVDVLKQENTRFYVRGIRNTTDLEYENANHYASRRLDDGIITLYIPAEQENIHVSSSLVKTHVRFNKDYSDYIPEKIRGDFERIAEKKNV